MLSRVLFAVTLLATALAAPLAPETMSSLNGTVGWAWNQGLTEFARDLSRVAYCVDTTIAGWHCDVCTGDFVVKHVIDENTNPDRLQGFVGHSPSRKLIVVAMRGSVNLANWISNLKFDKIDSDFNDKGCTGCKIHRGFLEGYRDISAEIIAAATELAAQFPTYEVLTTGHSLGGALAIHAALDLAINHGLAHRVDTITFGQPRMGNEEFAAFATATMPEATRVVHHNDIVPHLPFNSGLLPMDFHHNAREVWNTDNAETITVCDGSGEDPKCSLSVGALSWSIPDHLWYFGKPHGCGDTQYSTSELIEMQRVQDDIIASYQAAHAME